jgi:hypothetical protein
MVKLPLSGYHGRGKFAYISDEDALRFIGLPVTVGTNGYCYVNIKGTKTMLQRFIMDAPEDVYVDHINHDRLDNRRENLRFATASQNTANRDLGGRGKSGYRGVHWSKQRRKWRADIHVAGRQIYLGLFEDAEAAARAYDWAAVDHYGEFAQTNF